MFKVFKWQHGLSELLQLLPLCEGRTCLGECVVSNFIGQVETGVQPAPWACMVEMLVVPVAACSQVGSVAQPELW